MKITRQQYDSLPPRTVSGRSMRSVAEAAITAASSGQFQPRRKQKSRALLVTESQEQAALIAWCDSFAAPSLARLLFAIPNGAKLPYYKRSNGKRSSPEAVKLLREGMRPGIPDLCLPISAGGFHSLWIEMKAGKNKTTPEQDFWIATLRTEGHRVEVCYGAEAAKKVIVEYLGDYAPLKTDGGIA